MNTVEFKEYRPTPGEKHLGIATILINNLIYLRYKISQGKQNGYFPNPPSYKVTEYGQEMYISAFVIESNMLKEQVEACLKANVNRILDSGQHSGSIFSTQAETAQPNAFNAGYNGQQVATTPQQFSPKSQLSLQHTSKEDLTNEEIPF